jgi:TRAP transporter TAXI family solute receptor
MHRIKIYAPAVLLVLAGFVVAFQFIKPAPPRSVTIASGAKGGAYHQYAEFYARRLAKEGIRLKVLETAGSVENIRLLREGKADIALVQGGIEDRATRPSLESLGSLYYEPLWLFHAPDVALDRLGALSGLRVAIGKRGSGTRALVSRLLHANGLSPDAAGMSSIGGEQAMQALFDGSVDAAFFVSSPHSELIQRLLHDSRVQLTSFERADAYARRYRFLTGVDLPEGLVDLQHNIPAQRVKLLAPAANLVVNADIHPAIIDLLLQAASRAHAEGGWFEAPDQFPSDQLLAYPLADEARRYYRHGPPFLQRYLPFWAASLIDRLKVMLLPLVLMLLPLLKIMPPIYQWRMSSRVYRWYKELARVDLQLTGQPSDDRDKLAAELDRIESEVRHVNVPLSFAHQLYHLRQHIDLLRRRL